MVDEIQLLKNDIALNNVIIFIGSDVSFYTTNGDENVSHWKSLLKHGIQYCYQSGLIFDETFEDFNNTFNSNTNDIDDYLLFADKLQCVLKDDMPDVYKQLFIDMIGQLSTERPQLIQAIEQLECPILTTNYDLLIENILNRKPITWGTYTNESSENLYSSILHIYGYFNDIDSIIFSSKDYRRFNENPSIQSKFESLIKNKTLLFIGYDNEISDPHLSNFFNFLSHIKTTESLSIYKLTKTNKNQHSHPLPNISYLENLIEIPYGNTCEDLLSFIINLKSFQPLIYHNENLSSRDKKESIREKYLNYLLNEYGHISIFEYSNTNMNLPLESVYVELKFDPTHPSIKAMKTVEIHEEFKRKLFTRTFFTDKEMKQLKQALIERNIFNFNSISKDFMTDQWLNVLLSNTKIFTETEARTIKNKIIRLKQNIIEKNNLQETQQYKIEEAYCKFKHFLILGHPGSGKTTLSKWLVMNLAKQCLGQTNNLFNKHSSSKKKIPILIPIWKYIDQIKQNEQKTSLLEFIYENPTFNSTYFTSEEKQILSLVIMESLIKGNVLVIFEGLDEVPMYIDQNDLIKEINFLLEHSIDYDHKSNKLCYSMHEYKEINNTKNPLSGNRFIITSRIEGNYFEDINFFIPRLTIENMSTDALKLFCRSYTECIQNISRKKKRTIKKYQPDQLYNDITLNKDIFQLAINPQLASVIATIYTKYNDKLPERRIDLYETAIHLMIQRLITNSINDEFQLNETMIWSILEHIAEYLHSKVEGLSEDILKYLIKKSLIDYHEQLSKDVIINVVDDFVLKLVDMFKYQVGLLNEFGHDSFRFIHRTFQEYLAAKYILYSNRILRSENMIYENIFNKINIPNWRVPLSMTFGILSQHTNLFNNILNRLLKYEQISSNRPFIIIDLLNDMDFSSVTIENELIEKLFDMLLFDYKNLSGFARLKQHQELIHSYFLKLKIKYSYILAKWFIGKMNDKDNIAPCAKIIYELKWYRAKFHKIFINNLNHDSVIWSWPIDLILRYHSNEIKNQNILTVFTFKNRIYENYKMIQYIFKNNEWLRLILILYGGFKNYNTPATIAEYYETAQFLGLSENQRKPFVFYYQDIWGRGNTEYNMAVHLDKFKPKNDWKKRQIFDVDEIYKESFLTSGIIKLLDKEKSAVCLIDELRIHVNNQNLTINQKIDASLALMTLGDFDFLDSILKKEDIVLKKNFENRIEQLICTLKDPVARCSSSIIQYLHHIYDNNKSKFNINFADYCKIYLSLIANSGGLPVDTKTLAEVMDNNEDKHDLYAEYFAFQLTGAHEFDMSRDIRKVFNEISKLCKSQQIIKSFLKLNQAVQLYRPIRAYPWVTDTFNFKLIIPNDIPIAFLNCLGNLNTNLVFIIQYIIDLFHTEGYFQQNPELIPIMVLFTFGTMSKDLDGWSIHKKLLPELVDQSNMKEFLYKKIQSMLNPYYKSRALYQLAQFYDEKSYQLLCEALLLAKTIKKPVLKFQILEQIFNIMHYKNIEQKVFINEIINELIITFDDIDDPYERVIGAIRLSFYGSGEFRKKYLANALKSLSEMNKNDEKMKIIIKLKPLIGLYDDLHIELNSIIEKIQNKTLYYFVNSYYGKILFTEQSLVNNDQTLKNISNAAQLQALFLLFAQLNDMKIIMNNTESIEQLWINLFKDPNDSTNIEKILNIGLRNELFLTPQVAIIMDELIQNGKEDSILILLPYIIKPSNESLPIVHRWFIDCKNKALKDVAALLLTEAKYIYEATVDSITDLLKSDNDQLRYRAQRIFQHPERDPKEASKRISVLGEKTLMKILYKISIEEQLPRIRTYLRTFFADLIWDDPMVVQNLYENIRHSEAEENGNPSETILFLNRIHFIDDYTWSSIMKILETLPAPRYVEQVLHSIMTLTQDNQISAQNWTSFSGLLSTTDTSQFREQLYFVNTDVEIIQFILNEICTLTYHHDETYFEILQTKVINTFTVNVINISHYTYLEIKNVGRCNFYPTNNFNQAVLDLINTISINVIIMGNLIKWLIQIMKHFKDFHDPIYNLAMINNLLALLSACVQKEDYLYKKITNSQIFNKFQFIKLLQNVLHHHPYFTSRGNAFILLSAIDHYDHQIIVNAMNTLFDENVVKKYSIIGIPLIHLSADEFLDNLLESLDNQSAIQTYEILKIFTEYALNEKIDTNNKSKILIFLTNKIGQLKSKKPINYYYTDIKIPFTTTLEDELYKAWTKIQGLSGKTLYSTADVKNS